MVWLSDDFEIVRHVLLQVEEVIVALLKIHRCHRIDNRMLGSFLGELLHFAVLKRLAALCLEPLYDALGYGNLPLILLIVFFSKIPFVHDGIRLHFRRLVLLNTVLMRHFDHLLVIIVFYFILTVLNSMLGEGFEVGLGRQVEGRLDPRLPIVVDFLLS